MMKTDLEIDGYRIENLSGHFDKRGYWVEEFKTADGREWMVNYPPETWTNDIRQIAIAEGIIK